MTLHRGIGARTRTEVYEGPDLARAEARFRPDAAMASGRGWYPIERQWDGTSLRVTYRNVGRGRWRSASDQRTRSARLAYGRLLLIAGALAIAISAAANLAIHGHLVG
jgi:hypothetical protein